MTKYQSKYNGCAILNSEVKSKYKNTKFRTMKVLVPEDVISLLPSDCVFITYKMAAVLLHISVTTLTRKLYEKEIKSVGTKPGLITLEEYQRYATKLSTDRLNRKFKNNFTGSRVPKTAQHIYNEEEANKLHQIVTNLENNGEMKVQNI